ncbi:hypothetical protein CU048_06010 [Beijerinckiaceae bacterium]|nr:hypothetical protein CU048_06010 [Beijerinckiaceae bacterium]
MAGETVSISEAAASKSEDDKQTRQRSTIAFPYEDLDSSIKLVEAIHGNAGLGDCGDDQLAAWSGQSPKSSGFRIQIAAARLFGLIDSEGGHYKLTQLGASVMDPAQARTAKAQAFLNVPLFKAIFEKYKGSVLPSQASALEREIVGLGVSDKVKDRARVKFEKSAEQAAFFEHGKNRLVMPAVATGVEVSPPPPPKVEKNGGGDGGDNLDLDPLLIELLKKIPAADAGWPAPQRLRWFRTFAMNVSQIYDDDSSPVELDIKILSEG